MKGHCSEVMRRRRRKIIELKIYIIHYIHIQYVCNDKMLLIDIRNTVYNGGRRLK